MYWSNLSPAPSFRFFLRKFRKKNSILKLCFFRRRTEKMQTRKNRKNDEISYEKMFKMGYELKRALSILEMVKKREACKKDLLQLTIEIFARRYQVSPYWILIGPILRDATDVFKPTRRTFIILNHPKFYPPPCFLFSLCPSSSSLPHPSISYKTSTESFSKTWSSWHLKRPAAPSTRLQILRSNCPSISKALLPRPG